jgi:hypothetical protein
MNTRRWLQASDPFLRTTGVPDKKNHTISAQVDREQWVYADQYYLYFRNGILTDIQTDSPDSGYYRVIH